jgi:hypothetical protein
MTNRDLAGVAAAVVAVVALAAVFVLLRERSAASRHEAAADTAPPVAEPTAPPPAEPEPEESHATDAQVRAEVAPTIGREPDGGPRPEPAASHDSGAPTVLRASSLLIHPVGHEKLCVDYSSRKDALHLFGCHGRNNQRWTAEEDVGGTIRLLSGEGGCVIVQGTNRDGEPALTLGGCGATASRFRHFEEHRLQETQTGKCVGARRVDKGTMLGLEVCDPSSAGQLWALAVE